MANRKDEAGAANDAGSKAQGAEKSDDRKARTEHQAHPVETQEVEENLRRTAETGRRLTDQTLNRMEDMAERQEQQGRTLLAASTEAYRELTDFSRADLDALLQSGARLAQGLQEVGWEVTNLTQQTVRLGLQLASNLLECRTMEDMVGVHRDFIKETVDTVLAESARIFSVSSRVASEAVTPLGERASQMAHESHRPEFLGRPLTRNGQDLRH